MANNRKFTDEQALDAYRIHGNIWKAAKDLHVCGQSLHERLVKIGFTNFKNKKIPQWELDFIKEYYNNPNFYKDSLLNDLVKKLNRTKQFICRKAKKMNLTNYSHKKSSEVINDMSIRMRKHIKENGHPKGMLGKKHNNETLEKMSIASSKNYAKKTSDERAEIIKKSNMTKIARYGNNWAKGRVAASWKCGWRLIGETKKYYRSRWEANYARYLEFLRSKNEILKWEHEPHTFWFDGIKRGCMSYLPDFRVTNTDGTIEWHEVKGWMDDRSITKIRRMAKYFPEEKLILIQAPWFKANANKLKPFIKDWE